jgi:hypothetical protein
VSATSTRCQIVAEWDAAMVALPNATPANVARLTDLRWALLYENAPRCADTGCGVCHPPFEVVGEWVDTETCPEHGEQTVTGYGATRGSDPYGTSRLACGHTVVCFGPGEGNVIL